MHITRLSEERGIRDLVAAIITTQQAIHLVSQRVGVAILTTPASRTSPLALKVL